MSTFKLFPSHQERADLQFFSGATQEVLALGIELYDQAYLLYPGIKVQRLSNYRKSLRHAVKRQDVATFRQVAQEFSQQNGFDEYVKQCQSLQSPASWREIQIAVAVDERASEEIQAKQRDSAAAAQTMAEDWAQHGKFAHYSSQALWYIATEILPTLERTIQQAIEELAENRHRLKQEFYANYHAYLTHFSQQIAEERQRLAHAMWARLQVASARGDTSNDDLLFHLQYQLKKWQALAQSTVKKPRKNFTPETFIGFQRYIYQHGSEALKIKLHRLHLFASILGARIIIQLETNAPNIYILESLSSYTEQAPARWPWLFPGHQFRYQFFIEKRDFLTRLRLLEDAPFKAKLPTFLTSPLYQELEAVEQLLQAEYDEAGQKRQEFSWVFQRKTRALLQTWQTQLKSFQQQLLLKKFAFATHLVEHRVPIEKNMSHMLSTLQAYLKKLQDDFQLHGLDAQEVQALQTRLIEQYPTLSGKITALVLIAQLQASKAISEDDMTFLLQYEDSCRLYFDDDNQLFFSQMAALRTKAEKVLRMQSQALEAKEAKMPDDTLLKQYQQIIMSSQQSVVIALEPPHPEQPPIEIPREQPTHSQTPLRLSQVSAGIRGEQAAFSPYRATRPNPELFTDDALCFDLRVT